ncbi:hypothetical protein M8J77_015450 [Diaphorina citri]|nr:hypothetical protein M8J77_015450 [Diaphorina citri]
MRRNQNSSNIGPETGCEISLLCHKFGAHCSIVGFSQYLNNPKIQCLPTMLAPVAMRIYYMSKLLIFLTRLSGPRNIQSRNQSLARYKFLDPAGNRTRVSRVQGERSDHYTMWELI